MQDKNNHYSYILYKYVSMQNKDYSYILFKYVSVQVKDKDLLYPT